MDMEEIQVNLEKAHAKNNLIPRIIQDFVDRGAKQVMQDLGYPVKFGLHLLAQISLHKRAAPAVLIGIMANKASSPQEAANLIDVACQLGFLKWDEDDGRFCVILEVLPETQQEIDQFQYPVPMVCKPNKVGSNRDTGYKTLGGSIILRKNHHDDDVNLDHINRVNQIELSINHFMAMQIKNRWRFIDKPKPGEDIDEFKKRLRAYDKFNAASKDVIEGLITLGNKIYLIHKYDKRGRTYSQGYHVNYQGNDWCKSVIEFANKEIIDG